MLATILVHSSKIVKALDRLGITRNKVHRLKPSEEVPEHLLHHYYRGLLDADGTIFATKGRKSSKSEKYVVSVVGTESMATGFRDFILRKIGHWVRVQPHGSRFRPIYSGIPLPQQVIRELFREASIFLDRKKEIADRLLAIEPQRKKLTHITKERLQKLRAEGKSWYRIAKDLGTNLWTLFNKRKEFGFE